MRVWERDKRWSDQFIPAIKRAVAQHLIVEAPLEVDATEATDLLVFHARDMRIAARVRKYDYLDRYGHQFTIRSERDSGAVTEFEKIMKGWGDWMFYGFAEPSGPMLAGWRLIDLSVFRYTIARMAWDGRGRPWDRRSNGDGTRFASFTVSDFPPDLLIDTTIPADADVFTPEQQVLWGNL